MDPTESESSRLAKLTKLYEQIIEIISPHNKGRNDDRDLQNTPERAAKALLEMTLHDREVGGLNLKTFPHVSTDQVIVLKDMPFVSLCSHHLCPFQGKVSVAYTSCQRVFGLSKLPRLVQHKAAQLNTQERLCSEIGETVFKLLGPGTGVVVKVTAEHTCMSARGVRAHDVVTDVVEIWADDYVREMMLPHYSAFVNNSK